MLFVICMFFIYIYVLFFTYCSGGSFNAWYVYTTVSIVYTNEMVNVSLLSWFIFGTLPSSFFGCVCINTCDRISCTKPALSNIIHNFIDNVKPSINTHACLYTQRNAIYPYFTIHLIHHQITIMCVRTHYLITNTYNYM